MRINVTTEPYTKELRGLADKFYSGNEFLDQFIRSEEAFNDSLGKTFVWINEKRTQIIGYYNLGIGYIDMYDGQDKYKISGSIHLNFFALNEPYRGLSAGKNANGIDIKISDKLFADFMTKVYHLREKYVGFSFVTLAATDEGYSLYKRNYFEDLEDGLHFSFKDDEKGCKPMYFSLDVE